jgi:serine/threonine-protein kinase
MSPEQCRGEPLDRRSDIFSLGSTLYCLVAGRLPFLHEDPREVLDMIASGSRPPEAGQFNEDIPLSATSLLMKAMAAHPRDRFQTAAEMATKLGNILRAAAAPPTVTLPGKQPAPEPSAPQPQPTPLGELLPLESQHDVRPRRLPIIGGALAAVGALALLAWVIVAGGKTPDPPVPPPIANMIYIEPGYAQLGNDPGKLQRFFTSRPECAKMSADDIQGALRGFTLEPQERVFVPGFHIDRYEVTNAEYAQFVAAANRTPPSLWHGTTPPIGRENNPVADIRYEDAEAYALWKGKKLPTREQWVRAFRGDSDRLFPWGDDYDSSRANVGDNKQFPYTSPVTQTPQDVTATNVFNMVGNAAEYIRGVMQHEGRSWRVLKGASYNRLGFRYGIGSSQLLQPLDETAENTGFRCVVETPARGGATRQGASPK